MKKKKCNCSPTCTCGCQEGKECTCNEKECNCTCEDNCTCDEKCDCGCNQKKTKKNRKNSFYFFIEKIPFSSTLAFLSYCALPNAKIGKPIIGKIVFNTAKPLVFPNFLAKL